MDLSSPAFENGGFMPERYTCSGLDINPPLVISELPAGIRSLALLMHDPDAPSGDFIHWLEYDIEPVGKIREGSVSGTHGINSMGKVGYGGPCPPSGATHSYHLKVYALDIRLELPEGSAWEVVRDAMRGHVLASGELTGRFPLS